MLERTLSFFAGLLFVVLAAKAGGDAAILNGDSAQNGLADRSRFQRTAAYIQSGSESLRAEFATVALKLLAQAYLEEATLATEFSHEDDEQAALRSWAASVERYARQFSGVLEDVALGFPVALTVLPDEPVAITVAERALILTHPRLVHQAGFEQQVLQAFCSKRSCNSISDAPAEAPDPVSGNAVQPQWSFSADGPVCSHEGIEIHFSRLTDLGAARSICKKVLTEAVTLATEIAWQVRHSVVINWSLFQLFETPGRPRHRLQLNAVGDVVLADVPIVFSTPNLLEELAGWMRSYVEGSKEQTLVLRAAEFEWDQGR